MPIAPAVQRGLILALLWLIVVGSYVGLSLGVYALPFPSRLTPFWPGPGVALVALCLGGWRMLPAVVVGGFVTALATGAPLFMATVIMMTASLESVLIWKLGQWFVPHWWRFERQAAVVAFAVPTLGATGLAALLGCIGLEMAGVLGGFTARNFAVWWIGDGVGTLIMAPLLLSLARRPWQRWRRFYWLELLSALAALVVVGGLVHSDALNDRVLEATLTYLTFPILVWLAVRFEVAGASLGMLLITSISLLGTAQGYGPFAGNSVFDSLIMLQGFAAVIGVTTLVLAVEVAQGRRTRRQLKASRERLDFALWGTDLGLWDWDFRTGRIYFNDRWAHLLGYHPDELKWDFTSWVNQIHSADRDRVKALLDAHLAGGAPYFEADLRIRKKNGEWQWIRTRGKVVERDHSGNPLRAVGTHQDIDADKRQEQDLARTNAELKRVHEEHEALLQQVKERSAEFEKHAREDHLTSLPNRRFFEDLLEREWERARRFERPLTIAMADLDRFKQVNDEYSHQVGDDVLRRLGRRIEDNLRRTDFVARYGGEEFVLIFPETNAAEGMALCERLREAIESDAWSELAPGLGVTCSFGVAEYREASSREDAVALADRRLYDAKRAGRNRVSGPRVDGIETVGG